MRRPRPHRLTGSVRRLLAASVLGVLAAAVAVTAASSHASADGIGLNVNLNLGLPNLGNILNPNLNPVSTPAILPPPPSTATPSTSFPTLPGGALVPPLCSPNCTQGSDGTAPVKTPARAGSSASGRAGSSGSRSQLSSAANAASSAATSTVTSPQSVGLAASPPPPVAQLTPLAGISFGQAPYLWPLFLLLDVIAACAVVLLVRRTWSPTSGVD